MFVYLVRSVCWTLSIVLYTVQGWEQNNFSRKTFTTFEFFLTATFGFRIFVAYSLNEKLFLGKYESGHFHSNSMLDHAHCPYMVLIALSSTC